MILGHRKAYWDSQKNSYGLVHPEDLLRVTQYGLGNKRSLDAFIGFTGIDTRGQIVWENKCKQLQLVGYVPDKDPWVEDTDVWGGAQERIVSAARRVGEEGSTRSEKFIHTFYGNNIPLIRPGVKPHVPTAWVTATAAITNSQVQIQRQEQGEASPVLNPISSTPVWVKEIWDNYFGWVDVWVVLLEHIAVMLLPSDTASMSNGILVIKCLLVLVPVLCCMFVCVALFTEEEEEVGSGGVEDEEEEEDVEDVQFHTPTSSRSFSHPPGSSIQKKRLGIGSSGGGKRGGVMNSNKGRVH